MIQVDAPYSSFDDSEQFEDSSSWISDSDQDVKWSGWKRASPISTDPSPTEEKEVLSLIEICSKCVAKNHAFETVELYTPPIPDNLQLRIAYHSFPESEEEIRLYSCLASGSNDKFKQGEILAKTGNVHDVLQIGFHLSGVVTQPAPHTTAKQTFNIAITFDRGHITSCQCSCQETAAWCEHANALCIYRITRRDEVALRSPVSESLGRLERDQLQKFAQYLISELPQQILPTAQRLLDELLSSKTSQINMVAGAPDPTGGASAFEDAKWVLDEASLQENIKKILARFCGTLPYVMMDSNAAFLNSVPPVSQEWSNLLRSFQGNDPEALWNLLNISRHLYAKGDRNAAHLLHLITEECLLSYQMMFYWMLSYNSTSNQHAATGRGRPEPPHMSLPSTHVLSRHASAHLMEEIVHLWELTVMSPYLDKDTKLQMKLKFEIWNQQVIESGRKGQGQGIAFNSRMIKDFPGFNGPLEAAEIDWDVFYQVLGIPQSSRPNIMGTDVKRSLNQNLPPYEVLYHQLVSLKSDNLDEFTLVIKLSQALKCHGYDKQASRLAFVLGQKIILTYPERISAGELNFTEITEKAKAICEMFTKCSENERLTFELAILGLTVPRFPAQTNLEEMKLIYLETELYKCLKGMLITEERLNFIRYQARKLVTKPMLRGDIVLPYIIAMLVFEILCQENIDSCIYAGPNVKFDKALQRSKEDELLGYQCALQALGLYSNAVDHKQPMLCESIRQFRRELALVLLRHYRTHNEKIEEVLCVLLEKERYSFMNQQQHVANSSSTFSHHTQQNHFNNQATSKNNISDHKNTARDKKNKGRKSTQPQNSANKHGITFVDIEANCGRPPQPPPQQHLPHERLTERHSDSDSGNDDTTVKCSSGNSHSSKPSSRKSSQQHRRHSRQHPNKNRGGASGTHNSPDRRNKTDNPRSSWKQKGLTRNKMKTLNTGAANNKRSDLTDTDSGQEMNSPYEGDFPWLAQSEDWDNGMSSVASNFNENCQPASTEEYLDHEAPSTVWANQTSTHLIDSATNASDQESTKTESPSSSWVHHHSNDVIEKLPLEENLSTPTPFNTWDGVIQKASASETVIKEAPSTSWGDSSPMNSNIDEIVVDFNEDDSPPIFPGALPPLDQRAPVAVLPLLPNQHKECVDIQPPTDPDEDNFNIDVEMFIDSPHQQNISPGQEESLSDPLVTSSSSNNVSAGSSDSLDLLHRHPNYREISIDQHPDYQQSVTDRKPTPLQSVTYQSFERQNHSLAWNTATADEHTSHSLADLENKTRVNLPVPKEEKDLRSTTDERFETPDILTVSNEQIIEERPALQASEDNHEDMATVPVEPIAISENSCLDLPIQRSASLDIPVNDVMLFGDDADSQHHGSLSRQIHTPATDDLNRGPAVDDVADPSNDSFHDSGNDSSPSGAISIVNRKPTHDTKSKTNERTIELKELKTALSFIQQQSSAQVSSNSSSGSPMEIRNSKTKPPNSEARKLAKQQRKQAKKEKTKAKNNRNKARLKNTMNMQSIEAEAFSLFELAKALLTQYRNNAMPYFSVDVDEVVTNTNVNRRLQLAAFEIGIFALNIHNYSSPNWFSRTYSSYVSWIETLAIEIGTSAIRMLNEKWEGVLTPSEAIQIAGRVSRGGDQVLRRTAVELSLSCLPYCQSLNSVEVTQTMSMCREQDHELLERACSTLENASRQGGVQPELLFSVAREWHYLHEEKRKRESAETPSDQNTPRSPSRSGRHNARPQQGNAANFVPMYLTPEQFVQEQIHQQAQEIFGRQLPRNTPQEQGVWAYHPSYFNQLHHIPLPQQMMHSRRISNIDTYALPVNNFPDETNFAEIPRYLQNSYRVGMLALKALALRMPDDRPETRFAVAPPCSDDFRWLCALAASLGPTYLKNFCKVVYDAVTSPFLLHDLALEAARNFALYNPAHLTSHLRSPSVSPIVQKALVMFNEKVHYDLVLLQPNKYNDFVELLRRTRSAFCMAPGGMQRFNDILEMIRKTYPKKGELWQKIMNGLSTAA